MLFRRAVVAAALLLVPTQLAFGGDWLMGRYDAAQSSFTSEKLQLPVALDWEFTGNKYDNNPAAPVVAGGTCYFACGDRVYAVDAETGTQKWKYPSELSLGGSVKSTPAVYKGMVYFGAGDGNLYCVSAETGTFQWAYPTRGAIRCSPVILDGIIYVGADDNSVYAIDAASGDDIWQKPFTARDDIAIGLAVGSGMVVVPCMDGNLYGVNASSGRVRWGYRMPMAPVRTSPVIIENIVVMAVGSSMYGLSVRSGQFRWAVDLASEAAATPAADGMDIFLPCRDKKLYAFTYTGRHLVRKQEWTEPADIGTMPMSSPTIAGDTVFVAANRGVIAAFSTAEGALKWRYVAAPSAVTTPGADFTDAAASPAVAGGDLFVLTDDGVLHCFSPTAPDNEPPTIFATAPSNGAMMSGVPPIKISAIVYDIGSGVDPAGVTILLDAQPVESTFDPGTSRVTYITDTGEAGKTARKLDDGVHTITVSAKDYEGNIGTQEWYIIADNSLPPPRRVKPADASGKKDKEPPQKSAPASAPSGLPRPAEGPGSSGGFPSPPPPPPMPGGPGGPGPGGPPGY